jgi:NTE family protein
MLNRRYAAQHSLALLDNQPLCELLHDIVQFTHIDRAIARDELDAVAITALNYSNARSTTFFQGKASLHPWRGPGGDGIADVLSVPHLLASSAIPTLFPARKIGQHYFGDGALRQTRPLSAAINLGAEKLLIIGVNEKHLKPATLPPAVTPPTIPQVLGQLLNAVFLDAFDTDIEQLQRINILVEQAAPGVEKLTGLKKIDTLTIVPSRSLSDIAKEHIEELPRTVRFFLKRFGVTPEGQSASALSYILFEQGYCQALIELGFQDAIAQYADIQRFFGTEVPAPQTSPLRSLWDMAGPVVRRPIGPMGKIWLDLIGKRTRRV